MVKYLSNFSILYLLLNKKTALDKSKVSQLTRQNSFNTLLSFFVIKC